MWEACGRHAAVRGAGAGPGEGSGDSSGWGRGSGGPSPNGCIPYECALNICVGVLVCMG